MIKSYFTPDRKVYKVETPHWGIGVSISPRNPNYIPSKEDFKKAIDVALNHYTLSDFIRSKLSKDFLHEFLKLTRKERNSLTN